MNASRMLIVTLLGIALTAIFFFWLGVNYQKKMTVSIPSVPPVQPVAGGYDDGFTAGYEARKAEVEKKLKKGGKAPIDESLFGETKNEDGTIALIGKIVSFEDQTLVVQAQEERTLMVDAASTLYVLDQYDPVSEPEESEDLGLLEAGRYVSLVYQPQDDAPDIVLSVIVYK